MATPTNANAVSRGSTALEQLFAWFGVDGILYTPSTCRLELKAPEPGGEFLSDAPFFGLSLWTEFKLVNCACASGWSCLMNLDLRSKFWVS